MARTATAPKRRSLKIHSGDQVKVIAGKDRGKTGKVMRVEPTKERVYVEGLNMVKRHMKPQQVRDTNREQTVGGVISSEGPIHVSNVMLIDPKGGEPTRVRIERENGKPLRVAKRTGTENRLSDTTMTETATKARLKTRYLEEIRPALIERFGYSSPMQAPKLEKITLNMGVGLAKQDSKMLKAAQDQLATIAGQQPSVRRARKSIAAFKLREGMPVGVAVTLRGERGYEFLDRLVSIAIPRIRDFRGLSPRSFDGRGNYTLGVKEQIIFPEIDYDGIDQVRGLDITITTSAKTDAEAFALLMAFGMPFSAKWRPKGFDEAIGVSFGADRRGRCEGESRRGAGRRPVDCERCHRAEPEVAEPAQDEPEQAEPTAVEPEEPEAPAHEAVQETEAEQDDAPEDEDAADTTEKESTD